jgi:hypothetical protein
VVVEGNGEVQERTFFKRAGLAGASSEFVECVTCEDRGDPTRAQVGAVGLEL